MAYREVSRVEIAEVVRRWQSGNSQRQIATGTGLSHIYGRLAVVTLLTPKTVQGRARGQPRWLIHPATAFGRPDDS